MSQNKKTNVPDGMYFVHGEPGMWDAYMYTSGKPRWLTSVLVQSSHDAVNDRLSGIGPSDDDVQTPDDIADQIANDLGLGHEPYEVGVTQPR